MSEQFASGARSESAMAVERSQFGQYPVVPSAGQAVAPYGSASLPMGAGLPRKQGAWGLWWLCAITFGIYYLVWYARVNRELCEVLNIEVPANGQWWNQFVPVWNLVGLAATAKRVNEAHAQLGSPTRVGIVTTWLWATLWFSSQTRYLQRRINILHDVMAAKAVRP